LDQPGKDIAMRGLRWRARHVLVILLTAGLVAGTVAVPAPAAAGSRSTIDGAAASTGAAVPQASAGAAAPKASAGAVSPAAMAGAAASARPGTAPPSRPTDPVAHDPTMVKEGGYYYVIITGDAGRPNTFLPIKRSRDLVHWEELGPVFASLPAWVAEQLGTTPADAWAPDLVRVGGTWLLYYAVSRFGTQDSVIGLATTATLDPASPDYGWTDQGMVLRSTSGVEDYNAIDPEYVRDGAGGAWLAFGSFWGGIKMRRLDPQTGKLSTTDTTVHTLASRIAPNAEEGPSIIRHGGYYYLFLSFDFCCRGVESDYRMVVGRSTSVTGPYVDRAGVPLTSGGGTEVLRGYHEFVGTGGGDLYSAGRTTYLVNHYYDATDAGTPRLNVRPVTWSHGWPVVGDPVNPSRSVGHGDAYVRLIERTSGRPVVNVDCGYEGADIALGTDAASDHCQQWQYGYRGKQGGPVGLDRVPAEQRLPALAGRADRGRLDQGPQCAARLPGPRRVPVRRRHDRPDRDQPQERRVLPGVPLRAGRAGPAHRPGRHLTRPRRPHLPAGWHRHRDHAVADRLPAVAVHTGRRRPVPPHRRAYRAQARRRDLPSRPGRRVDPPARPRRPYLPAVDTLDACPGQRRNVDARPRRDGAHPHRPGPDPVVRALVRRRHGGHHDPDRILASTSGARTAAYCLVMWLASR
jgi:hypothetical protein